MPFQSLAWMRRHGPFLRRCHAHYGDIFTLRLAYEGNVVILAHPDAVREVFTGDPSVVHAGEASAVLRPIVGRESLLVLDDRPHLLKRKLLLPQFHGGHMPGYEALMREVAEREVERWPNDQAFSLLPRMHTIAVEVILQALLGVAQGSYLERLRDSVRELLDRYTETRTMAALFILGPALTLRVTALGELLRRVDEALYAEIACRRHDRNCEGREDVISLLLQARLEDGAQMSDEDVRDQLMSLIVAGHETTGTALAWALERLLRTPSALRRLREEIAAGQDAYADAVCKETLRLRPVVPVVTRRLQESLQIGGWLLPAGATVAVHRPHPPSPGHLPRTVAVSP